MSKRLVGSAALKIWFPEYREPADFDYFTDEKMPGKDGFTGKRIETFWHPDLDNYQWQYPAIATSHECYTIKASHMFWTNRWVKHAKDVIWLQEHDSIFIPELYDVLYPIWVEHYGAKRASLPKGTKPEDFFNPKVDRVFEHDSLHASVAYYDRPLFNAVLEDGEDVAVSWEKFEQLTHTDKLRLVREEVYATALERHVIPSQYTMNHVRAYRLALQQTITSFWKGKWALFAVLNLKDLVIPELDYVQLHHDNKDRLVKL